MTHKERLLENLRVGLEQSDDWAPNTESDCNERRILIFDGANRGRYIGEAVIRMAKDYGLELTTDAEGRTHDEADDEFYAETTDEAVDFLNELTAESDFSFAFEDGDFFAKVTG